MPRHPGSLADNTRASWLADLRRDLPYAIRSLSRSLDFSMLALFTLAIGIGANAAIFSVVNAVLLRPLPYAQPERLVRVFESMKDNPKWYGSVSIPNFKDWREQSKTIEQFVAYQTTGRNLESNGEPERLVAVAASANLFVTLRVPPIAGRTFAADEDLPGHDAVAVLSEGLWRRRFGGQQSTIGKSIVLDGRPHVVVGVMPAGFVFPAGGTPVDLWVPYVAPEGVQRGNHALDVVGRIRTGIPLERATAEMHDIAGRIERQFPDAQANRTVALVPLQESIVGSVRWALLVLLGAVGLVLLITCANVANLMLARAATRRRDVALRIALGASRSQLVRQYLTESLCLSLGGAALGTIAAWWGLKGLTALSERVLPLSAPITLDAPVFVFLLMVSVLCGVIFGLAPAMQARPSKVRDELAGAGTKTTAGGAQQRFRSALVVAQMAMSLVLLIGAGLLMRAFVALRATDSGISTENVLVLHLSIPRARYSSDDLTTRVYRPILEGVRAIPGVRDAGMISRLPIENWGMNGDYWVEGRPRPEPGKAPMTELRSISPGYFAALGIRVRAGRDFTESDGAGGGNPVIINEAMVRREFKGENPIGRQLRRGDGDAWMFTIVGVASDVRQAGLDQRPLPETYFPYTSAGSIFGTLTLVVKMAVPSATATSAIRSAVQRVAPDVPLYAVRTMDEVIGRSLASRRLNLWLLGIFAGIALLLAASGLYGVISYLVAQRTKEIGIRMALGADRRRVVRLVIWQGAALALIGVAVGLAGAFALTRLLATMLYGVSARDPVTFAGVPVVLVLVALVASYVPAWRASRVDPMVALRAE